MTTNAFILSGALIEWSGDDGTTWAAIPEAKMVAIPTVDVDFKDVTSLNSPGGFREYIAGLFDGGQLDVECNYIAATYATALAYRQARAPVDFRVTLPLAPGQAGGDVFTYKAYVNPKAPEGSAEDTATLTLDLKMTGELSFVEGAAA